MGAESLGMWERYGANAKGVAIGSTVGSFKAALQRTVRREQYAFGAVRYHIDVGKAREVRYDFSRGTVPGSAKLWKLALGIGFNKRTFFVDEQEWRAAMFQEPPRPRDPGIAEPFDLDVLISTVRVCPRA